MIVVEAKLWKYITVTDDCWYWTGQRSTKSGHGRYRDSGQEIAASKAMYLLYCGDIPEELCVLHFCDNAACVNPEHLYLGTHIDNMQDMVNRGRARSLKGSDSPRALLTQDQVTQIRTRYRRGCSTNGRLALCKEYGVSSVTIGRIVQNKSYTDL